MDNSYRKDLHTWFGLSYSAFLVMPRVAMMQMPKEWQEQMSELLHQYDETINTGGVWCSLMFRYSKRRKQQIYENAGTVN